MFQVNRSLLFALFGVAFGIGFYQFDNTIKDAAAEGSWLRLLCNCFELLVLCPSMGVLAWLVAENIRNKEVRLQRRLEEERERRFLLLGRIAASVAHEFRNPLHHLRLVGEELRAESPADCQGLIDSLDANLRRLDLAMALVYELSRPNRQADGVEADAVVLAPIIAEAVDEAQRRIGRPARVAIAAPVDAVVVAGREASLRIALGNLVRNAVEAAGDGEVSIGCQRSDGQWLVEIANPGQLPEDVVAGAIPHASAKPDGMGVGLSIARHLVEQMGGRLTFANRAGMVVARLDLAVAGKEIDRA